MECLADRVPSRNLAATLHKSYMMPVARVKGAKYQSQIIMEFEMPDPYFKDIICLANSRKLSGHCVAGREVSGKSIGPWIRPVSAKKTGELSGLDVRFQDGKHPEMLDIIRIKFIRPISHGYQTENHEIESSFYWEKKGKIEWTNVQLMAENVSGQLWLNADSSYHGENDRVSEHAASTINSSLKLIMVDDFRVRVLAEGAAFGNSSLKVRGSFTCSGFSYSLMITDPVAEADFRNRGVGAYEVGRAVLCISLGEPHEGFAYKLIAGVILPD